MPQAGTVARIYTIASPYLSTELAQIKFAQDVNIMILNHPNYAAYKLTLLAATNWTLAPVVIGSTVSAPVGQAVATTLVAGTFNYAYEITAGRCEWSGVRAFGIRHSSQRHRHPHRSWFQHCHMDRCHWCSLLQRLPCTNPRWRSGPSRCSVRLRWQLQRYNLHRLQHQPRLHVMPTCCIEPILWNRCSIYHRHQSR